MADYKKKSHKREVQIAKDIGGKTTPGSGCFWNRKGDAVHEYFLIEDKFTEKARYSLNTDILDKIEKQSNEVLKTPILTIGFECDNGENFVVVRKNDYNIFIDDIYIINTSKKSMVLHLTDLKELILTAKNSVICGIKFSMKNTIYLIMKYDDFVEKLDDFIAR
jgi:hypothetical protein